MSLVLYLSIALNSMTVSLNLTDKYTRTEVHMALPLTTLNQLNEDHRHINPYNCNIIVTTSDYSEIASDIVPYLLFNCITIFTSATISFNILSFAA
jgi:hypothetical protein